MAVKGDLSDPATSISGTNGFGLICGVKTKNTPKIWFARIAADGTYLKGHFLDQLVKRIEYAYQDGSILGLANTSIPAFIMVDPQGKIVWQYKTKTAESLAAENIAIAEVKDGYVITYYSHMVAQTSSQGINYKLLKIGIEKIDRYGKIIWTKKAKYPLPLFH